MSSRRGILFIVSAPSGAGKTTVVREVVATTPDVQVSQSYTSRAPRGAERDGVDYHFVSRERFVAMREAGEFLEWADVFGQLYGTAARDTESALAAGRDLVLVIDVQGAAKIRRQGVGHVSLFLAPPSVDALEQRLQRRAEDGTEAIQRRLAVARHEMESALDYDYLIVNDDLERCVADVRGVVLAERNRMSRRLAAAAALLEAFGARLGGSGAGL